MSLALLKEEGIDFPHSAEDFNPLKYDLLGHDLIKRVNEMFSGTIAEIPIDELRKDQEIRSLSMYQRLALTSSIFYSGGYHEVLQPITPFASEVLLRAGEFEDGSSEHLALILYDKEGANSKSAKSLRDEIRESSDDLGLYSHDFEHPLIIVNAGLEKNEQRRSGLKPKILPDYTKVFSTNALTFTNEHHQFFYGFERGLPRADELGEGPRTLKMPMKNGSLGLRMLYRNGFEVLDVAYPNFSYKPEGNVMTLGPITEL